MQQAPSTDGMAIAALITGIVASFVGIILGAIALNRIKKSGQGGRGMAIAGIIIGAIETIGYILIIVLAIAIAGTVASSLSTLGS
jgi:hypothetical protein